MTSTIAVAGATGNLGGRIAQALRQNGAEVWALVRPETGEDKLAGLIASGCGIVKVDLADPEQLQAALKGADVVVSALQGLRDVIIGTQGNLLKAAVAVGVRRFIPSDYAADFTRTAGEPNRNFDMRRDFGVILDAAPIEAVSVLNGMFMDLLAYGMPLFDLRKHSVSYWGEPDQLLDLTTMDDTAAASALVALDPQAPRYVRVAGDQISPTGLAALGGELTGTPFALVCAGSIDDLGRAIEAARTADPQGETQEFPRWQQMQYSRNMMSGKAKLDPVDNARFPSIRWTSVRDLATGMLARQGSR
ncbi:MAG: NmrA-like family protein [Devosia sp.]|uniref:aromatic alcohol reductase n=1 Tax=Devosia sp. TaxID=1871048 RepID=UPI00260C3816|nr:aromatic alcohol reductase [Devosia sp.]MDB5528014.1 NmrA-like family protein [Devosia sp.]